MRDEPFVMPMPADPGKPPGSVDTMSGIAGADPFGHMALWYNGLTGNVERAMVVAWRVFGACAYPVTVMTVEPQVVKCPDGIIVDQSTGRFWRTEGAWIEDVKLNPSPPEPRHG